MMRRSCLKLGLILLLLVALPYRAPAPLVYRPGEGWTYEMPGAKGSLRKNRAKDQLELAQQLFDQKKYKTALDAAKLVLRWPFSDYAPKAQYLIGRCYYERHRTNTLSTPTKPFSTNIPRLWTSTTFKNANSRSPSASSMANGSSSGATFLSSRPWTKRPTCSTRSCSYGPYGELGPPSQMNIGLGPRKGKRLSASGQSLRIGGRPLQRTATVAADALYKAAHGLQQTSPQSRLRSKRGGPGHLGFHRFHGALSQRPPRGGVPNASSSN